jgi:hypothetical protein
LNASKSDANEKILVKLVKNEEKKSTKYQKPARRHTIALSALDILASKNNKDALNTYEYETLANIFINTNDEEANSVLPYNEFNYLTNQELRQQLNTIEKNTQSHIFRQSNKSTLEKDLPRLVSNNRLRSHASKSIGNLPSLTIKMNGENRPKTTLNNVTHKQEHQVKTTILNLSPLSISASSVTTGLNSTASSSSSSNSNSSSINSLINNTNKNKIKLDQVATNLANEVGSITKTAVNTIATDLEIITNQEMSNSTDKDSSEITNKFHSNFLKQQNVQFNCTFESLI